MKGCSLKAVVYDEQFETNNRVFWLEGIYVNDKVGFGSSRETHRKLINWYVYHKDF